MKINLTTYLNQLGFGVVGLNVLKGLVGLGHEVSLWVMGGGQAPKEDQALVLQAVERKSFFSPCAPSLRIAHPFEMAQHIGQGSRLGMTFFELDELSPQEKHHLSSLDYVIVSSDWAVGVLLKNDLPPSKIICIPLGADPDIFHPYVERKKDLSPDLDKAIEQRATIFMTSGKWEIRKGHDVILRAFCRAFTPSDNVFLVMNCSNPFLQPHLEMEWVEFYRQSPMGKKIFITPNRLPTQHDLAGLMACADCGLFPSRAEGWNLELGEMMAMGKQVIATHYSAHTQILTPDNSLQVHVRDLEPAFDGTPFFKGDRGRWARLGDDEIGQIVQHMQSFHDYRQGTDFAPNQAGIQTMKAFTWKRTALALAGLMEGLA